MDHPKQNSIKERWISYITALQGKICEGLETLEDETVFRTDEWQRDEGGGGLTKVLQHGSIFEKAGVNSSVVHGSVTDTMRTQLKISGHRWFACGLSLVIHPVNPFVPTVHANWRYFELYDQTGELCDQWFGGGADLTPYYLFEEDATHFHVTLRNAMQPFGKTLYPRYKKWCDTYFNNAHRGTEARGVGGVFYDHLKPTPDMNLEQLFRFQQAGGDHFMEAYLPIVLKRKDRPFTPENKYWQEIRRGRYVEFNLIHDRGTIFGLKTRGRVESILMSLPPTVRFDYDYQPVPGSEEWKLLEACRHPRDWA